VAVDPRLPIQQFRRVSSPASRAFRDRHCRNLACSNSNVIRPTPAPSTIPSFAWPFSLIPRTANLPANTVLEHNRLPTAPGNPVCIGAIALFPFQLEPGALQGPNPPSPNNLNHP
jgi:hypothetical protein